MNKILLIDGHSILNRAYYGVPDLTNREGLHTNAIYGFLNIMFKAMEDEKPTHLAVAFDLHAPTFRHQMYPEYKGTRHPMPDELREQVPKMKELLLAMNIPIMEKEGLEADDLLGSAAKQSMKDGWDAIILSGDRDLLQISDEHIKIRIPKTKGGKTEVEEYYPSDVVGKYGVTPLQFIDVKALMGDSSDNIPGVPKVGEKTAVALIQEYGSIDGIYENIDSLKKGAVQTSIAENKENAYFCRKLVTIVTDAELPIDLNDTIIGDFYNEKSFALIKEFELKSFLSRFDASSMKTVKEPVVNVYDSFDEAKSELAVLLKDTESENQNYIAGIKFHFLTPEEKENNETTGEQISLFDGFQGQVSEAVSDDKKAEYIKAAAFAMGDKCISFPVKKVSEEKQILEMMNRFMLHSGNRLALAGVKEYYTLIPENLGKLPALQISNRYIDTVIGAYLLNPLKNDYDAESVIEQYANPEFKPLLSLFDKHSDLFSKENLPKYLQYLGTVAQGFVGASGEILEKLADTGMDKLFTELEMPLSYVLFEMEREGIRILPGELKQYSDNLQLRIEELQKQIIEEAEVEFNINSPKQLGEILFEKKKIPGGKKTKTGYSTAADVLEKLAPEYPFVAKILEYRALTKLKSTYADGLATQIAKDGRIHTTFQQTVTATGRLSSTDPNLQNIPIRTELGRLLRKVFVPKDGYVFMDADYSQIELRILAHLSNDPQLIEAYNSGEDIHAITASRVFHVPFEEVTPLLRRRAKAVNFGIVYGISSFGLSQDLNLSKKEAQQYIDEYFVTYPGIKEFLDGAVNSAKECGYSKTMYDRRRPIPELKSSNFMQRSFGERVAMNAPIQGTAADIMKIAMLHVRDALTANKLESKVLIQVHDELLLEVKESECDIVRDILKGEMERAAGLLVKLEVDLHTGNTWYDAK